jgi:hypothetical protein
VLSGPGYLLGFQVGNEVCPLPNSNQSLLITAARSLCSVRDGVVFLTLKILKVSSDTGSGLPHTHPPATTANLAQ